MGLAYTGAWGEQIDLEGFYSFYSLAGNLAPAPLPGKYCIVVNNSGCKVRLLGLKCYLCQSLFLIMGKLLEQFRALVSPLVNGDKTSTSRIFVKE